MERTDGIHIFIISLMLAIGCGFFLWGTVLHKVEHPLERKKANEHIVSTPIELTSELETELSKVPAFRVNAGIRTKKSTIQKGYVSESEIRRLTIAPYAMGEVASRKALPSLTIADLNLILEHAILDSGIEEKNIDERIGQPTVDSPFPLRKSNPHISFPQKREQHAIVIQLTNTTLESEQNSRISGSSGHRRNKANTSKSKSGGGSYSYSQKSGLGQSPLDEFVFEAEDATSLTPYFEIGQDKYASNSKYISAPESGDATALNGVGSAEYHFEVKKAGVFASLTDGFALRYKVFGRIIAPTAGSDSFYIRMDNGPLYTWDLLESPDWTWQVATQGVGSGDDLTFELEAGEHILSIGNREDGTMLDILVIQRLSD